MPEQLNRQYEELKATSVESLGAPAVANLISEMALQARRILRQTEQVPLTSATGKNFFSFLGTEQSRPVNAAIYEDSERKFSQLLRAFRAGLQVIDHDAITRAAYSIAYSIFGAHDVHGVGRKASATFFEILVGHMVARAIGVPPRKKVLLPESPQDEPAYLPTDYLFDPGPRSRKIHLPIKTFYTRARSAGLGAPTGA